MAKSQNEVEALEELGKVPDVREVFEGGKLRSFSHYIEERISVTEQIKALEESKKEIDAKLTLMMKEKDTEKVLYQNRPVSLVKGSRSSLNKEKLLLAGVAATTITACTDYSNFTYLLVGKDKHSR